MLSQLTDPKAVDQALDEFDELGRQAFLEKYGFGPAQRYFVDRAGRQYDSKAIAGAAYGFQHPDRGPLTRNAFSGGDSTVRSTLARLGFVVVDQSEDRLSGLLEEVAEHLQLRAGASPDFSATDLTRLIQTDIPRELDRLVPGRARIRGSAGIGTLADVPWVGLFPADSQASAKLGFYLVLLFSKDGKSAYLAFQQGTENTKGGEDVLFKRSIDLRRAVGPQDDLLTAINLGSTAGRPRKYEAATAYAIHYESGAWPQDAVLASDIIRMLDLVDIAQQSGLEWPDGDEPLHLVFKWRYETEPLTVELHRRIAGQHGSAWWGRFSASPAPSLSPKKLDFLNAQLAAGVETHAYLYRRGDLWRTSMEEIAVDPPEAGDPRFPDYYTRENCNLFVRLTNFESLSPAWLPEHAVLASHPDADPSRLAGALGNQTTPLFVYELWQPGGPKMNSIPYGSTRTETEDEPDILGVTLADVCQEVSARLRESGLAYGPRHDALVKTALVSLATKRFLLLTGLSGSGKTRLAIAIGEWLGPDRLAVIPVRPDWTGPDALLGFENGLSAQVEGRYAWSAPDALRFILRAARDPKNPYLLVLDEMNLAHVERYFADVLSGMESRKDILPNLALVGTEWRPQEPEKIPLPENLFVVGTVNIDETTYMFSPKVLDRANTLEFRVMTDDLEPGATATSHVETGSPALVRRFLHAATTVADDDWDARSQMAGWLQALHRLLTDFDREFGHRVFFETLRFGALLSEAGQRDALVALDLQVLQKILPRFHGSIRQVAEPLHALGAWCFFGPDAQVSSSFDPGAPQDRPAVLPMSFDKVQRMTKRLRASHFVAFAE